MLKGEVVAHMNNKEKLAVISEEMNCPCGSGKIYMDCCKDKRFKWVIDEKGKFHKSLELDEEVFEELEVLRSQFKETFGRDYEENDRVFYSSIIHQLNYFNDFIRTARKAGIEESHIYAYYKTDGLIVTELNKDQLSDKDIEEWREAIYEFEELMNEEFKDNQLNIVQAVLFVENALTNFLEKSFEQVELGLAKFIVDSNGDEFLNLNSFQVLDHKSFMEFCLYKTIKNLNAIKLLFEHGHKENALAIVRFLYDIYLNVIVYSKDVDFFNEKIVPLIGLEKGTHIRQSKHKIKDLTTGRVFNTKTTIYQLAQKAKKENPTVFELYESLFSDLSGYVHVNISVAGKYFSENDPYYELNEELIAGVLALLFSYLQLYEVVKLDHVSSKLRKDILYLANKISSEIKPFIEVLKSLEKNPIFNIMNKMLMHYTEEDHFTE